MIHRIAKAPQLMGHMTALRHIEAWTTFSVGFARRSDGKVPSGLPVNVLHHPLILEGGTHNVHAPPFDFIEQCFLPIINRMGPTVSARLVRHGFYPRGGGRIEVDIMPAPLQPIECTERGKLVEVRGQAVFASLSFGISDRMLDCARRNLSDWPDEAFSVRELPGDQGPGVILMLGAAFANVTEVVSGFGQLGVPAERLAKATAGRMSGYLETSAFAGPYLAD